MGYKPSTQCRPCCRSDGSQRQAAAHCEFANSVRDSSVDNEGACLQPLQPIFTVVCVAQEENATLALRVVFFLTMRVHSRASAHGPPCGNFKWVGHTALFFL